MRLKLQSIACVFQNVVETVGNPIDILVIQPEKDPFWINKKKLGIDVLNFE